MKGWRGLLKLIQEIKLQAQARKQLPKLPALLHSPIKVPPSEWRVKILPWTFSVAQTTQMQLCAREHQTTVHGLLAAALCRALLPELPSAKDNEQIFTFFSPVDIRPRESLHHGHLGLFASVIVSTHRVDLKQSLWALAQEVGAQIREYGARGTPLFTVPVIGWLINRRFFVPPHSTPAKRKERLDILAKMIGAQATTGLTNLGKINLAKDWGPHTLEEFLPFVTTAFNLPLLATAVTHEEKMIMSLIYCEPLFVQAQAERMALRFNTEIEKATALSW
jgi:hypothetical protein